MLDSVRLLDRPMRVALKGAHLLLRSYWAIRRPHTRGALVALWCGDRILLVKNSYRRPYTLPGGYVRPWEDPRHAAARELSEEVGVTLPCDGLAHVYHGSHAFESRTDTLDIYEAHLEEEPHIRIDRREIIWAEFVTPERARSMELVPHVPDYLDRSA